MIHIAIVEDNPEESARNHWWKIHRKRVFILKI